MKKVKKLKDNKYLSTETIVHNNKLLSDILNESDLTQKLIGNALDVCNDTLEHTLLNTTIQKGTYIISANVPVNFYGSIGRELYARLKVNNVTKDTGGGVINSEIYTLHTKLFAICEVSDNSTITITLQNTVENKNFACGLVELNYIKLK